MRVFLSTTSGTLWHIEWCAERQKSAVTRYFTDSRENKIGYFESDVGSALIRSKTFQDVTLAWIFGEYEC